MPVWRHDDGVYSIFLLGEIRRNFGARLIFLLVSLETTFVFNQKNPTKKLPWGRVCKCGGAMGCV